MRPIHLLALAGAAVALAFPSGAVGAVREGAIDDPPAPRTPAFDNANAVYEPDIARVAVAYDEAGTVRASVSFYEPPGTSSTSPRFNIALQLADCTTRDSEPPTLRISMDRGIYTGNVLERAFASRSDASGNLQGTPTVSPDGRTFTIEFTHTLLAGHNYTCVQPTGLGGFTAFYFDGFQPPPMPTAPTTPGPNPPPAKMTALTATAAADAYLTTRYAEGWTTAPRKWLKCPKQEIFPDGLYDDATPAALCEFEMAFGQTFRGGSFLVTLDDNEFSVPEDTVHVDSYSKERLPCTRLSSTRRGWVNGVRLTGRRLIASGFLAAARSPAGPAWSATSTQAPPTSGPTPSDPPSLSGYTAPTAPASRTGHASHVASQGAAADPRDDTSSNAPTSSGTASATPSPSALRGHDAASCRSCPLSSANARRR